MLLLEASLVTNPTLQQKKNRTVKPYKINLHSISTLCLKTIKCSVTTSYRNAIFKDKVNKKLHLKKNKCFSLFTQMSFQVKHKHGAFRLFKKLRAKTFKYLLFTLP